MDAAGRGVAVYRVVAGGSVFHFVAFTTTLDESVHTDRVVADAWEVAAALVEGELTDAFLAELAHTVPLQERGRLDPRVLVLTRGNRSVRFFEYLVDRLASGRQPDPDDVGDAGYIMRSTAFYANGKFGMKSFLGYPDGHPLGAPYRAQMLAAWLFRELGYDSVENCARLRGGDAAIGFAGPWRQFFGLGNATGLGLVPYFVKHPCVVNAWFAVRESALAHVRSLPASPERLATLRWWIDRAALHFASGDDTPRPPWSSPHDLANACDRIRAALAEADRAPLPFDELYRWAECQDDETCELVVSMLIELDDSIDDELLDEVLRVDEDPGVDPLMTIGRLGELLTDRFAWLDELRLDDGRAAHYWWVISDNTEEPRRAVRRAIAPRHRAVAIDVALRLRALRTAVEAAPPDTAVGRFLADHPEHAPAVARVASSDLPYAEARDNVCDASFLPLQMQRFQLAMYGMDNFSPKSTDWLRVTLYQGAPRVADIDRAPGDGWVWPPRPAAVGEATA